MQRLSKIASRCLKATGIGLASLAIALPATAQGNSGPSIAQITSSSDSFDVLESLLEHAGWTKFFDGSNGKTFTVFAPTDDAFSRLPEGVVNSLYKSENRETLYDILAYHVIGGEVMSSQLASGPVKSKAGGLPLQVTVGQEVRINNATVQTADISASNGVVHVIDTVLIPQR